MSMDAAVFMEKLAAFELFKLDCWSFVGVIVSRTINDIVV